MELAEGIIDDTRLVIFAAIYVQYATLSTTRSIHHYCRELVLIRKWWERFLSTYKY